MNNSSAVSNVAGFKINELDEGMNTAAYEGEVYRTACSIEASTKRVL